jgi:hypothetical protein
MSTPQLVVTDHNCGVVYCAHRAQLDRARARRIVGDHGLIALKTYPGSIGKVKKE